MTAQRRLVLIGALVMAIFAGGGAVGESAAPTLPICLLRAPALAGECQESRPSFEFTAVFSPRALPSRKKAPIALGIAFRGDYEDVSSQPPPLKELLFDFDRQIEIDTTEIPTCGHGELLLNGFKRSRRICHDAIVGTGTVEIVRAGAAAPADTVTRPMRIFNTGIRAGVMRLLLQTPPLTRLGPSLIAPLNVKEIEKGRFDTQAVLMPPPVSASDGTVVGLRLWIKRRLADGLDGIASASCAEEHLLLRISPVFVDGTRLSGSSIRACAGVPD